MDNIVQPFDYNPVATSFLSDSYTVPVGRYALVKITLSAKATATIPETTTTQGVNSENSFNCVNESKHITQSFWLKSGDAISKSATNASGNATVNHTSFAFLAEKSETSVSALINGTSVMDLIAIASVSYWNSFNGVTSETLANFAGSNSLQIAVAEYANIS